MGKNIIWLLTLLVIGCQFIMPEDEPLQRKVRYEIWADDTLNAVAHTQEGFYQDKVTRVTIETKLPQNSYATLYLTNVKDSVYIQIWLENKIRDEWWVDTDTTVRKLVL